MYIVKGWAFYAAHSALYIFAHTVLKQDSLPITVSITGSFC